MYASSNIIYLNNVVSEYYSEIELRSDKVVSFYAVSVDALRIFWGEQRRIEYGYPVNKSGRRNSEQVVSRWRAIARQTTPRRGSGSVAMGTGRSTSIAYCGRRAVTVHSAGAAEAAEATVLLLQAAMGVAVHKLQQTAIPQELTQNSHLKLTPPKHNTLGATLFFVVFCLIKILE